jgi:hypothetical protein
VRPGTSPPQRSISAKANTDQSAPTLQITLTFIFTDPLSLALMFGMNINTESPYPLTFGLAT